MVWMRTLGAARQSLRKTLFGDEKPTAGRETVLSWAWVIVPQGPYLGG